VVENIVYQPSRAVERFDTRCAERPAVVAGDRVAGTWSWKFGVGGVGGSEAAADVEVVDGRAGTVVPA
jgi:hypothetical protein